MYKTANTITINELIRDPARIVARVVEKKESILIEKRGNALVVIRPIRAKSPRRRKKTLADYKAFLAAAGSWKDVDTD